MLKRLSTRIIAAILLAVAFVGLVLAVLHFWQSSRTNAARARLSESQAGAVSDSARDAINATGAVSARSGAADAQTRQNEEDIRHAQGADAPVDPIVRDAGLRSLCGRPQYSSDPKCVRFLAAERMARGSPAGTAPGR